MSKSTKSKKSTTKSTKSTGQKAKPAAKKAAAKKKDSPTTSKTTKAAKTTTSALEKHMEKRFDKMREERRLPPRVMEELVAKVSSLDITKKDDYDG